MGGNNIRSFFRTEGDGGREEDSILCVRVCI